MELTLTPFALPVSTHAATRCLQRGLSAQVLEWLDEYGARAPATRDAEIVFFDKPARRRLQQALGSAVAGRVAPLLGAYMIQGADGKVVTAGWRLGRIDRKRPRNKGRAV